jgi:hypothetical protein
LNVTNLFNKLLLEERVNAGWFSAVAATAAGIAESIALPKNKSDKLVVVVATCPFSSCRRNILPL